MATVTGITAAKALEIENASVVSGYIDVNGALILTTVDETVIVAGQVVDTLHPADQSTHGVTLVVGATEPQTLTNKTLTTPIIASLINAQHDHGTAAKGGGLVIGVANNPAPITTLSQHTLVDVEAGVAKNLASLTLAPGRWLILATCEGVTLATALKTRFSFNISTTSPTLVGRPVASSCDTISLDGGRSISGWLDNALTATVTFTITKNGTGAQATNSTIGQLIAIRMG